jgi:hypothetical protein
MFFTVIDAVAATLCSTVLPIKLIESLSSYVLVLRFDESLTCGTEVNRTGWTHASVYLEELTEAANWAKNTCL